MEDRNLINIQKLRRKIKRRIQNNKNKKLTAHLKIWLERSEYAYDDKLNKIFDSLNGPSNRTNNH